MGFTSDACWFLLIKTLLIKNNKKREAALKNEAGGDEKRVCVFFFLLGLRTDKAGSQQLFRPSWHGAGHTIKCVGWPCPATLIFCFSRHQS